MKMTGEEFDEMMDNLIRDYQRTVEENIQLRAYLEELCQADCPEDYKRVVYKEIFG